MHDDGRETAIDGNMGALLGEKNMLSVEDVAGYPRVGRVTARIRPSPAVLIGPVSAATLPPPRRVEALVRRAPVAAGGDIPCLSAPIRAVPAPITVPAWSPASLLRPPDGALRASRSPQELAGVRRVVGEHLRPRGGARLAPPGGGEGSPQSP